MHTPRPRSWIAVAGLVLLAGVLPVNAVGAGEADEPFDTVLITVEAGPEGAEGFRMGMTYGLEWSTDRARAIGSGIGTPEGGHVFVSPRGSGPFRVTTTQDLTGSSHAEVPLPYRDEAAREHLSKRFENEHFSLSLDLDPGGTDHRYSVYFHELEPDSERVLLVFHAGAEMVDLEITDPAVDGGSAVVTDVETKHGARVLQQAEPENDGTAVGVGPAAAGASSFTTTPAEGIAGEVFWPLLTPCLCVVTVTAPDGRTKEWVGAGPFYDKSGEFLGPAGTWEFSWAGLGASIGVYPPATAPSFGAYTTVGELWPYFQRP